MDNDSSFQKKKICFDWDLNIVVGKGDSQTKSFNIDIMQLNNIQNVWSSLN